MAICHADQRYYLGQRSPKIMRKKLPMALIHECCGKVVYDSSGTYEKGQRVVMIPNTPTSDSDVIFENYHKGSYFLSSGYDGFMRELIYMPLNRVVPYDEIKPQIAAITEFVSVAVHAITRFDMIAHKKREIIGIWGDGSLSYTVASMVKELYPLSKIVVVGKHENKLSHFSFVDNTYTIEYLPSDFEVDHAFECTGGEGSYYAIDDIINYINPQGTIALMGVSENKVPVYTRNVLEKGLIFVGCSRSGKMDFEKAIELMKKPNIQNRLATIVYEDKPVSTIDDIHKVFEYDLTRPFKTVFKWCM
ncbi:alcohol dehydrogenase [Clostridium botulinum BKT015925]|nr:alcohol dehydrogenase [Clostridium botulinum BKT015925]